MCSTTEQELEAARQSLLDNGEQQPSQQMPYKKPLAKFLIVFLALGWFTTLLLHWNIRSSTGQPVTPIPSDVFKRVTVVFERDDRYVGPSVEAKRHWDDLVAGHDALWIENPGRWDLPPGIDVPYEHPNKQSPQSKNFYVVSLLHQLHCLNIVRFQYWEARLSSSSSLGSDASKWAIHVDHCFEYLRQSISCGGDLIIEGASPLGVDSTGGHATSVSGWGTSHECIDFKLLRAFQIEQERKYNMTWQDQISQYV